MPLWTIYHPPTTFTTESEKSALSADITKIYSEGAGLPPFYVVVHFIAIAPSDFYIGGIARPSPHSPSHEPGPNSAVPMIRITIQNIARKIESDTVRDSFLARVDSTLKPYIEDKGYDWEYSVLETSRDLWKVQGLVPPMPGSEAEKLWARVNNPVPFKKEQGNL